ncbi:MAG: hypothetical protein KJ002_05985 [Candidatus Dadabacteria bacterium]|nr:hypothetical protein [Candidatus Dadabacteria bacterium]
MSIVRVILLFVFLFALIGALCWGIYKFIVFFFSLELDPNVVAGLIGATALISASIGSIIIQKRSEQKLYIQIEHRKNFGPIYEKFINNILIKVLLATKLGEEPLSQTQLIKIIADFTRDILVWGSNDVLKAYQDFRKLGEIGPNSDADKLKVVYAMETLILTMRKDLGHSTKDFKKGDILRLFVNDIDNYLK